MDIEELKRKRHEYYLRTKEEKDRKRKERIVNYTPEELAIYKAKQSIRNAERYAKNKEKILGYKKKHREKYRNKYIERAREKRANATERPFDYLKREYGLTKEDYLEMLKFQNGVCAICCNPEKKKRLAVDHCHNTGKIRGLLCTRCNTSIGRFNDDVELLQKAIDYLKTHDNTNTKNS
jgi:hypothetical protein